MNRLLLLLLFALCGVLPCVKASHETGVQLNARLVKWEPGNQRYLYTVSISLTADCSGAFQIIFGTPPLTNNQGVPNSGASAGTSALPLGSWEYDSIPIFNQLTDTILPFSNFDFQPRRISTPLFNQCENPASPIRGLVGSIQSKQFYLEPGKRYVFLYDQCCRDAGILNISPNQAGTYVWLAVDVPPAPGNLSQAGKDSLSTLGMYDYLPPAYGVCNGKPALLQSGLFPVSGDSIRFRFGKPMNQGGASLTFMPGFSQQSPIPSSTPIALNSRTGDIYFTPNQLGKFTVNLILDVYRNGRIYMTTFREYLVLIQDCGDTNSVNPSFDNQPRLVSINGKPAPSGFRIEETVCTDDTLDLALEFADSSRSLASGLLYRIDTVKTFGLPFGSSQHLSFGAHTATLHIRVPKVAFAKPLVFPVFVNNTRTVLSESRVYQMVVRPVLGPTVTHWVTWAGNVAEFNLRLQGGKGPFTFRWSGPAGLSSNPNRNLPRFQHTYPNFGSWAYTLEVTDSLGCVYRFEGETASTTSREESENKHGLALQPNPTNATTTLQLNLPTPEEVRYTVADLQGRTVRSENLGLLPTGLHSSSVDLSQLPAGLYLVQVSAGATRLTERVVKY